MRRLRGLWRDRSGASTLMTVLMLPVLLGFTAFAIDGGMAYMARRNAQNAADSAAFSAATALAAGDTNLINQAKTVALQYGLVDGQNGVSIRVEQPPTSGTYANNNKAVAVTITRPMMTFFSQIFGGAPGTLRARSVSLAGRSGDICVLALNPTAQYAVLVNGIPVITLTECAMQINSNNGQGMLINGGPKITAEQIRLVGSGYLINGTPIMNLRNGFKTGADSIADPYATVPVPQDGCNYTGSLSPSGTYNVPRAGPVTVICGNLDLTLATKVTFPAGIYVFANGANFTMNGFAAVDAQDVTFVFRKSGTSTGRLTINGTGTLTFKAPDDGVTGGLIFFTDPGVTSQPDAVLNGSNSSVFNGAIHLWKAKVTINGTNSVEGQCLQLVADTVVYNGGGTFGLDCGSVGVRPIGLVASNLVE